MGRYDALPPGLAPRGLTREAAAAYVGLSPAAFDKARRENKYPGPTLPGGKYDLVLLQLAMDRLSGIVRASEAANPPDGNDRTDHRSSETKGFNDGLHVPGKGTSTHLKDEVQRIESSDSPKSEPEESSDAADLTSAIKVPPYVLFENPPTGTQPKIAWVVAKYRWPDGRIPRMKVSEILKRINLSIVEMRKKGTFPKELESDLRFDGKITRDTISRLLGRKKELSK
jgi:hypothetical protein